MRLVVTAVDFDAAVTFYRDALGLPERASYASQEGWVVILEAGRATLEIADPGQAEFIDRVEVGRRVAGQIRVAFEVGDSRAVTAVLVDALAGALGIPQRNANRLDRAWPPPTSVAIDAPPAC